eukprot:SAG31_NODE_14649_length_794_cov_1.946763_1_plen_77_part_10
MIAQPGPIHYKLKLSDDAYIHDTFHVARLKPYKDPALVRQRTRPLPSEYISDNGREVYEVDEVRCIHVANNTAVYTD